MCASICIARSRSPFAKRSASERSKKCWPTRSASTSRFRRKCAAKWKAYGVRVGEIAIKDIILPGDVRDILNQVVTAEKQAQANLIRRREETAATRSLLNTAKLMEDNPLLVRLKELETLERVAEKVEKITVVDGLNGLLTEP